MSDVSGGDADGGDGDLPDQSHDLIHSRLDTNKAKTYLKAVSLCLHTYRKTL